MKNDTDNCWILSYDGFEPQQEGLREALCTLGNGRFATRGAAEEAVADGVHYPGTYVAGGYNRLTTEIAGQQVANDDLVNMPNWLPLTFRPGGGEWASLRQMELLSFRQELRIRQGVLHRRYQLRDRSGRTTWVSSRRFVSMASPHLAGIEYTITPVNWSGRIQIRSQIDGSVTNAGVERYRQLRNRHLKIIDKGKGGKSTTCLLARTSQSRLEVAVAARIDLFLDGQNIDPVIRTFEDGDVIGQTFATEIERGQSLKVEKIVALRTSRDWGITESALAARLDLTRCERFQILLQDHELAWLGLWRSCDVGFLCARETPADRRLIHLLVRLHIFHLLQTVSPNTIGLDVSVPARGLHGEAYRGHIFWDELFIMPLYNLWLPDITRSLLMYRYHRLDAARAYARENGYRGAMFPWQSSSTGAEETQTLHLNPRNGSWGPDRSRLQRHVNAVIVYNLWNYCCITCDRTFLEMYGAEIILEVARFWSSITTFNGATGRYEINGVMGPDEYHEGYPGAREGGLRNNAYTNIMAVWCLDRALDVLETLRLERRQELVAFLRIRDHEIKRWRDIARRMTVCFHGDGIISQFQGYGDLQEFDWDGYRRKYGNIERVDRILKSEGDSADRYKVSKQADVMMLFHLLSPRELGRIFTRLGYKFDDELVARNVDYYMRRTSHGSTLSRVVFASVLDRIDRGAGWELFCDALRSDFSDMQHGTTAEGIHLGAMAGTVDIVLRHYVGVDTNGTTIAFHPRLPKTLRRLRLRLYYREQWLDVDVSHDCLRISMEKDAEMPLPVMVQGELYHIRPGRTRRFDL